MKQPGHSCAVSIDSTDAAPLSPELESAVTLNERLEYARRLYTVERNVIFMRHIAMVGWGALILWRGIPFGLNFTWLLYLGCITYCLVLHAYVHERKNLPLVSWIGTLGDSVVAFLMCFSLGKSSSVFIPFFYFTLLASAFRLSGSKSLVTLLFNSLLAILLFALDTPHSGHWENLGFVLIFIGYSHVFGSLMSGWAVANLRRALMHSQEFERERDRSQELLHKLINAQEQERKKLAGELHDRMGERFFSICHGLDECIRENVDGTVRTRLNSLRSELLACTSYIRSFMNELRPTVLDELGLYEAILEYVNTLRDVVPFTVAVNLDPVLRSWRSREDAMLFRLVQEALLNVRKHSDARTVLISLQEQGNRVVLSIEDDGRGFDTRCTRVGHLGLLTMRERAEVSGGTLRIESRPQHGTKVSVWFDTHG